MCGIAGILHFDSDMAADANGVDRVLQSMRYRGPDALGIFQQGSLAMGNVRLAIQGIDPTGNQPIYNEDRSVVVVFNGEIYNYPELRTQLAGRGHIFSTETDTEVLVHLYEDAGVRMADQLNGMFAFALYDTKADHLLLGRDQTAQKPFFVYRSEESLTFASELRALLQWVPNPRVDLEAARDFLSLGYIPEPRTIVAGVESFPPGRVVRLNSEGKELDQHTIPFPELTTGTDTSIESWLERADGILSAAVRRHTLSDVPVTVFLSGGVDSSLLALYLRETSEVKEVFTGSFTDDAEYDEFSFGSHFSAQLGLQCQRVDLGKSVLAGALEDFCADSSQPQGDYSGLPTYVLARETAKSYRVVLGGDGGDELFSGYPTATLPALQKRFPFLPAQAIQLGAHLARQAGPPRGYLPLRFRLQLLSQAWGLDAPQAHFEVKNFLPPELAPELLAGEFFSRPDVPAPGRAEFARLYGELAGNDEIRRLGRLDFATFLGACTIPKMERNCMHWSLENRLPLLDKEMLQLAAETPAHWQRKDGVGKWCLRQLLEKKLGTKARINPRKQGFGPPLATMLQKEMHRWSRELLATPHPLFQGNILQKLEARTAAGWDLHRLVWNICILKDWLTRNRVDCP